MRAYHNVSRSNTVCFMQLQRYESHLQELTHTMVPKVQDTSSASAVSAGLFLVSPSLGLHGC